MIFQAADPYRRKQPIETLADHSQADVCHTAEPRKVDWFTAKGGQAKWFER